MKTKVLLCLVLFTGMLFSCRKDFTGDLKTNTPPETSMVADTIIRFGDNRFKSIVDVHWWGSDADGYVTGYEFSFDGNTWVHTTVQDTTFVLNLPGNSDTADFRIFVRSIDNMGEKDPSPAALVYPVKNSPPTVQFIISARTPVRSFPAVKYFWKGQDPDGDISIDHYELLWNDTTSAPLKLNPSYTEATFVAENITGTSSACLVYPATLNTPLPDKIPGMLLGNNNLLYVRSVDKVGATSQWTASPDVFIRKPVSDILFINAQQSTFNRNNVQAFYLDKVNQALNKTFDTMQAGPSGNFVTDLSPDPVTQDRVFTFFKKIFVYSENSEFILSLFQRSSQRFFTQGGKLMIITEGNDAIESQPSYLDFSPIGRYTDRPSKVSLLFNMNDSFYSQQAGKPVLLNGSTILTGIRPFDLPSNNNTFSYQGLYKGIITQDSAGNISNWKGNSILAAKRIRASDNQADFIVVMVPVYRFQDGAPMNLWFKEMLVNELKF